MITKGKIREDLYKAIYEHYEKNDYTEALRDAMFFVKNLLQEKSGLLDKDNTRLIEAALLGKNSAIKINKYETESEINFQEGIGFALKGLVMHLRNPISHDKIEYSEQDADAQLLYINYLINQIDTSSGRQLITDWLEYLQSDAFTTSEAFSQELIKELPKKQRYDLLVSIWRTRSDFEPYRIGHFVDEIINGLSAQEKRSFINIMESELISCCGDNSLSMMFHLFAKHFYAGLKKIVKLHIEDVVKKGISNGILIDGKSKGIGAAAATWAGDFIESFTTKNEIVSVIQNRFLHSKESCAYIEKFFYKYVDLCKPHILNELKDAIKYHLLNGDTYVYELIDRYKTTCLLFLEKPWEEDPIYIEFSKELELYEKKHVSFDDTKPSLLP